MNSKNEFYYSKTNKITLQMTTIKFVVPHYNKNLLEQINLAEQEVKSFKGYSEEVSPIEFCDSEIKKASEFYRDRLTKNEIENGLFPDHYYARLFELRPLLNANGLLPVASFLKIFPHRRDWMSTKYIAKQMKLDEDILKVWFKLESIPTEKRKGGYFVNAADVEKFVRKISEKKYELKILVK